MDRAAADITHHYGIIIVEGKCFQRSLCVREVLLYTYSRHGKAYRRGERQSERERKAEPASAAAVTVKEGRGEEEGADFDTADSPPPPPILVCDIL